jgi:hypothetical protein
MATEEFLGFPQSLKENAGTEQTAAYYILSDSFPTDRPIIRRWTKTWGHAAA